MNRAPLMISSNSSPALKPKNSTFLMFFSLIYAFNLFASSVVSSPIIFTWRSGIISYALTTVSTPFSSVTRPKYKPYVPTCGLPTSDLLAVNVGIQVILFSSKPFSISFFFKNSDGVINASTPLYTFIALCTFIEKTRMTDANSDPFTHLFFMQVLYPFVRHSSHGFLLYIKSNLGHSKK